ncbi:MAG: ATPase AAA [Candidatus Tectimicrobiota bacterium]|nr:MAG: ATPase AAA [Candidatus Tectomicrobia bacterium]
MADIAAQVAQFGEEFQQVRAEIAKVIVGHTEVVEGLLICLLCGGHALLEGVPGLGKTLLVKSLGAVLDLQFSRIQFTPDLMPADIIGTRVILQDEEGHRYFEFQPGPIFSNIVLADEINRATPKTQSALLEAMQERSVTVAGVEYKLQLPFLVLATQNPLEMEGTYPLPEAQLDRFFLKLQVSYPSVAELSEIVDRTTQQHEPTLQPVLSAERILAAQRFVREVPIASHVKDYAIRLVLATHPQAPQATELVKRYVRYGSSPRGVQSLVLAGKVRALFAGRFNVSFEDIRAVALPCLRHRLILNFEGEAEGIDTAAVIEDVLAQIPELPTRRIGAAV